MCETCAWSARMAEPGAAPSIRRREHSRRRVIFFTKIRNSSDSQSSAAGRAQVQLDAMAEEGIDLAILYPSRGLNVLSIPDLDRRISPPRWRAPTTIGSMNFCQADPSRLFGAGMVSPFDIDDAIAESSPLRQAVRLSRDFSARQHRQRPQLARSVLRTALVRTRGARRAARLSRVEHFGGAPGRRTVRLRFHAAPYLFSSRRADAGGRQFLRRRNSGSPSQIARGVSRRQLRLAALSHVAAR